MKLELQNYLLTDEIPTPKQPKISDRRKSERQTRESSNTKNNNNERYNLRKRR